MLTCDRSAKRHYGDDQGRYWSVSQVCEVVAGKYDFYAAGAAERGTDVHQIFALAVGALMGWCEAPDVPTEYAGYHAGILRWIEQAKPQPMMLEKTLRHKTLPYAGTLDYVGMLGEEFGVLDLKTGQPSRRDVLQVQAYQKLVDKAARAWVLYVRANGTFTQVPVKSSAREWAAFRNGLSILQWREG
ncbi:MAG: hypothetical protein OEV08_07610 [Nitrospira sp.]|nr:hypothetical protein [Nitrospira sp.]